MSNVGRTLCPHLAGNYVFTGPLAVQAAILTLTLILILILIVIN